MGSYGDIGGCLAVVQRSSVGVVLRHVVRGSLWDVGCLHVIYLPCGLVWS